MTALVVGTVLALGALSFVLYPLFVSRPLRETAVSDGELIRADASRNPALEALREIEFDRETGKLSESDYESLKASYMQQAVTRMREGSTAAAVCPNCGPRPESDAAYCSNCGVALAA